MRRCGTTLILTNWTDIRYNHSLKDSIMKKWSKTYTLVWLCVLMYIYTEITWPLCTGVHRHSLQTHTYTRKGLHVHQLHSIELIYLQLNFNIVGSYLCTIYTPYTCACTMYAETHMYCMHTCTVQCMHTHVMYVHMYNIHTYVWTYACTVCMHTCTIAAWKVHKCSLVCSWDSEHH